MLQHRYARAVIAATALAVPLSGFLSPAMAQAAAPESPSAALARHIRVLATDPRNFNALIGAGRAALDMGDVQAAAGFFGRAQEIRPNDWQAQVGVGAAMVQMGDINGALTQFDAAKRAGAPAYSYAMDLGMAHDLQGKLGQAQADYRSALGTQFDDEARRRLALSLAISGKGNEAIAMLQPLLNRRDVGAQRSRAFVFALTGQRAEAAQAMEQVMPGASARFEPFFRYLPNLSVAERAAAVHLGVFPEDAATRRAAAVPLVNERLPQTASSNVQTTPQLGSNPKPVQVAETRPVPVRPAPRSSRGKEQAKAQWQFVPIAKPPTTAAEALEPAQTTTVTVTENNQPQQPQPGFSLPSQLAQAEPLKPAVVTSEPETQTVEVADAAPPPTEERLSGIDKLLATIAVNEPPPAPQPKIESKKAANKARDAKLAEAKRVADKKVADAKAAADKKAKEEAALGTPGVNWIQLAGGSNQNFMSAEYRKLAAKSSELKKRSGYVTAGKDYFRLLVGPFATKAEAQALVNKLAKDGVRGFSWTRTPAQIKIEKLP